MTTKHILIIVVCIAAVLVLVPLTGKMKADQEKADAARAAEKATEETQRLDSEAQAAKTREAQEASARQAQEFRASLADTRWQLADGASVELKSNGEAWIASPGQGNVAMIRTNWSITGNTLRIGTGKTPVDWNIVDNVIVWLDGQPVTRLQ